MASEIFDIMKYSNITAQLNKREYGGSNKFYVAFKEIPGSKIDNSILKDFNTIGMGENSFVLCKSISLPETKIESSEIEINKFIKFSFPVSYGLPEPIALSIIDDDNHSTYIALRKWFLKMDINPKEFASVSPMEIDKYSATMTVVKFNKRGDIVEELDFNVWPDGLPSKDFSYEDSGVNLVSINFNCITIANIK